MFSTPENLLVGFSGALGMKVSHFLCKNVFWENAVGVCQRMVNVRAFKPLPLCSATLKICCRHFWSTGNERTPLSKQKYVLRKCCGVSQKWWMLELPNLCHCVQQPWKLTSRNFWSSRNERKVLSKLKHVISENVEGLSQKWWMLKLPNLCHCDQQPLKTY